MSPHLEAGIVRGIRAFVAAFLAIYGVPAILGALAGSQPVDTGALRSAAVAGFAGVIALFWRAVLDRFPIPTLVDPDQKRAAGS